MCNQRHKLRATVYCKRGKVLGTAVNSYTQTHPIQAAYAKKAGDPEKQYLHAEIAAIIKCRGSITRAHKIVVERYGKRGEPRTARPCDVCMLAIKDAGIKIVEHTVG